MLTGPQISEFPQFEDIFRVCPIYVFVPQLNVASLIEVDTAERDGHICLHSKVLSSLSFLQELDRRLFGALHALR